MRRVQKFVIFLGVIAVFQSFQAFAQDGGTFSDTYQDLRDTIIQSGKRFQEAHKSFLMNAEKAHNSQKIAQEEFAKIEATLVAITEGLDKNSKTWKLIDDLITQAGKERDLARKESSSATDASSKQQWSALADDWLTRRSETEALQKLIINDLARLERSKATLLEKKKLVLALIRGSMFDKALASLKQVGEELRSVTNSVENLVAQTDKIYPPSAATAGQ